MNHDFTSIYIILTSSAMMCVIRIIIHYSGFSLIVVAYRTCRIIVSLSLKLNGFKHITYNFLNKYTFNYTI